MDFVSIPEPLATRFDDALSLENKFRPENPLLPLHMNLTIGMRDGSAHVLRCLKMWYDLPPDVFFIAANLMDRFIAKVEVVSRQLACMSIASFQLACNIVGEGLAPNPQEIINISQARCSVADLQRMQERISSKLEAEPGVLPVTAFTFMSIYHDLLTHYDYDKKYCSFVSFQELTQQLEIVICETTCSYWRPAEIALSVLCYSFDQGYARENSPPDNQPVAYNIVAAIAHIHEKIKTSVEILSSLHGRVAKALNRYHDQLQVPYRQRLVWRLSSRTMQKLRPTENLVPTLPTIDEHGQLVIPPRSANDKESTSSNSSRNGTSSTSKRKLQKSQKRKTALK